MNGYVFDFLTDYSQLLIKLIWIIQIYFVPLQ